MFMDEKNICFNMAETMLELGDKPWAFNRFFSLLLCMFDIFHNTNWFFLKIIVWKQAVKGHIHTIHSLWIMSYVAKSNKNKHEIKKKIWILLTTKERCF